MEKLFEKFGRSLGKAFVKGKWIYQSAFGSERDAYQAELKVSRDLIRELKKEISILADTPEQLILESIGARLYLKSPDQTKGYRFYLISGKNINAFALPGGIVFMTLALYKKLAGNQDEIAFVLAHEMTHIEKKHLMNRIIANYSIQTVTKLLRSGSTLGALAGEILSNLLKSGFSQDNELEADQGAVILMKKAHFDPAGAIAALRKLEAKDDKTSFDFNYFSTHPSIEQRINAIKKLID